jgi:hypothetical protein
MREQKKPQDTEIAFKQAVFNLIPILGTSNIKKGRKVQILPVLLKSKRRVVLINKWLLSSQKNKSNIRGVNSEDVAKIILFTLMKKGSAYDQKMDNQKRSYNARYMLLRPSNKAHSNVGFNDLQRYVLNKLKHKLKKTEGEKEKGISDVDSLSKYSSIFKFLKVKSKSRFIRFNKKHFRKTLLTK